MKKYAIHPGWIISQYDGQRHWISGPRLIHLYRVNPAECVIIEGPEEDFLERRYKDVFQLYRIYSGYFSLE